MRLLVFLFVLLQATPAFAQLLERAPYLQSTSETQTVVAWKTWLPSDGEVHWGDAPGNLTNVVADSGSSNHHEVTITGLQADTRYYYAVYQGSLLLAGDDADHWFETNPPLGSRDPFRIWVVGDSGTGGLPQAAVRDAMLGWTAPKPPDLYLHVGDMAYGDGTEWQFTWNFYAVYASILRNTTVWPAMGNHEGHSSDSDSQSGPYYDGYALPTAGEAGGVPSGTEAYYSFDYGNAPFVVLDSHDSPREVGGAMLTWLEADLQATAQEWIIAFWHHPPYTKGSHDSDVEGQLIEMRENALPILEAGGVDLVLTGHSHIYERTYLLNGAYQTPSTTTGIVDSNDGQPTGDGAYIKDPTDPTVGTVHIVAGHGGTGVSQDGVHPLVYFAEEANGSVILDVHENRLSITNVRWDGVVTDKPAIVKGDAILVTWPDGGETLPGGQTVNVTWATSGSIPDVDVEWSCDGGATWVTAATGVPNTNSYAWDVPAVGSDDVYVRVSSNADPTLGDHNNAPVTIGDSGTIEAVSWGSTWTYDDSGTDLGTSWTALTYDDSLWASGPGQLGYGDGDEDTALEFAGTLREEGQRRVTVAERLVEYELTPRG